MARKCSRCGNIGHNSRTCPANTRRNAGGMKLFGVQLLDHSPSSSSSSSNKFSMKKSFSVDCFSASPFINICSSITQSSTYGSSHQKLIFLDEQYPWKSSAGYLSDGLVIPRTQDQRKKSMPWSEEEHRIFLLGLERLGKGDWRGISRNFVTTRTPTQVASHAQKYFLRQNSVNPKTSRRASLFDMVERDKYALQAVRKNLCLKKNKSPCSEGELLLFPRINNDNASSFLITGSVSSASDQESKFCQSSVPFGLAESYGCKASRSSPDLELTLAAPQPLSSQSKTSIAVV